MPTIQPWWSPYCYTLSSQLFYAVSAHLYGSKLLKSSSSCILTFDPYRLLPKIIQSLSSANIFPWLQVVVQKHHCSSPSRKYSQSPNGTFLLCNLLWNTQFCYISLGSADVSLYCEHLVSSIYVLPLLTKANAHRYTLKLPNMYPQP